MFRAIFNHLLINTLGKQKASKTFPKSAECTLGEQERPKVLPKGLRGSLKVHKSDKQSLSPKSEIYPENIVHFDSWRAPPNHKICDRRLFLAVLNGVADGAEVLAAGLD